VTQQPGGSGPDLIGDFQRWLIRSSARGMGRQVTDQIRSALGRSQQPSGDVWETATAEPPDEAPECAWCPLCRAARLLRESKAGRDTRVTAVSDALGTVVQDAFNVLEAALAATGRAAGGGDAKRAAGTASAGRPRSSTPASGPGDKPTGAKQRPGTGAAQHKPADRTAKAAPVPPDGAGPAGQPSGGAAGTPHRTPADGAAKARQAEADGASPGGHRPDPKRTTGGRAAGPKPSAADGAAHGPGTVERGPGAAPATAGEAPGDEPASPPPGGSPREPDDRG
jgi:hypothetical protein